MVAVSITDREAPEDVEGRIDLAAPQRSAPPRSTGLGVAGWLRWAWRTLTSMKTALLLLLLLVLAAIPGSVFPQRASDDLAVNQFFTDHPSLAPLLDRVGMFEVFGSPWFAAIYLLLFISLVGCVLPRSRRLVGQWRQGPAEPPRSFGQRPDAVRLAGDATTLERAADVLRRDHWRVRTGPTWVSAEKGFLREVGNLSFHFALVGLLLAVAAGSVLGWRGSVIVREGEGFSNAITQYDQWGGGRAVDSADLPPFAFTLDSFTVSFERGSAQRGAPRDFDAVVTVQTEPGAEPRVEHLRVNEPLRIHGADVYLIGHGYAPQVRVTSPDGKVLFDDTVVFLPRDGNFSSTGVIKIPDASPQLSFTGIFAPTAAIDETNGPHSVFPAPDSPGLFLSAFTGDLGLDSGVPQSVYKLDTASLTQVGIEGLAPGMTWTLPDGTSVEFVDVQRYVSLKISHDPGRMWALLVAGAVMAGLMISLFVPRRRIWIRLADGAVVLAELARTDNAKGSKDLAGLVRVLADHRSTTDAGETDDD